MAKISKIHTETKGLPIKKYIVVEVYNPVGRYPALDLMILRLKRSQMYCYPSHVDPSNLDWRIEAIVRRAGDLKRGKTVRSEFGRVLAEMMQEADRRNAEPAYAAEQETIEAQQKAEREAERQAAQKAKLVASYIDEAIRFICTSGKDARLERRAMREQLEVALSEPDAAAQKCDVLALAERLLPEVRLAVAVDRRDRGLSGE